MKQKHSQPKQYNDHHCGYLLLNMIYKSHEFDSFKLLIKIIRLSLNNIYHPLELYQDILSRKFKTANRGKNWYLQIGNADW